MEDTLIEQLKDEIRYEFSREGPPEGFPRFPDIPGGRYTDPAFFELEMKELFPRTWLMAGRQEELPEVGSYWLFDSLRDTPVVLVRDAAMRIRAFRNESPNSAPLVPWHDDGALKTEVEFDAPGKLFRQQHFPRRTLPEGVLRCQRRGWAYDTTGNLVSVPFGEDFDAIPYEQRHLTEYRCEVWGGWVFVNQDPDAMPLIEWLGPIARQMAQFDGENLRLFEKDSLIISCNWKVTVEAFQEVYHFKHIHQKQGVTSLDQRGATMGLFPNGHSRMVTPITKRAASAAGMEHPLDWKPGASMMRGFGNMGPIRQIETVVPMVSCTSTAFSIFPNLITPVGATGMPFLLCWPIDIGHTLFEWVTFQNDWGDDDDPAIVEMRANRLHQRTIVMEEDTRNMTPMQKSLDSPGLIGIPVSYQERRIWHCAETLDRTIGPERIPEHLRVPQLLEPYLER